MPGDSDRSDTAFDDLERFRTGTHLGLDPGRCKEQVDERADRTGIWWFEARPWDRGSGLCHHGAPRPAFWPGGGLAAGHPRGESTRIGLLDARNHSVASAQQLPHQGFGAGVIGNRDTATTTSTSRVVRGSDRTLTASPPTRAHGRLD